MRTLPSLAAVVAAFMFSYSTESRAEFLSGNDLQARCNASSSESTYYQDNAYCMGYIVGVLDLMEAVQSLNGTSRCLPADITVGQMRDVFKKYLADHPENRQLAADVIFFNAMIDAYGCRLTKPLVRH